jgi:hypothetical protein
VKIIVVDVDGSRVKIMVTGRQEEREVPSDVLQPMELGHLPLICQS